MTNEKLGPGKEVLCYCTKCEMGLAHTIVTMKDENTIGKCECNTCKHRHVYRDPHNPKKTRATGKRKEPVDPVAVWNKAMNEATGNKKNYTISGIFEEGDVINHSKFGEGVVAKVTAKNKVEVIFKEGQKILIFAS